jgi:two-component system chemotaxis sensor kinase CheA
MKGQGLDKVMDESLAATLKLLAEAVDKLALELVFATPGTDAGLLPANHFVGAIEDVSRGVPLPEPLGSSIASVRATIDHIFDSSGMFDAESLQKLRDWVAWCQTAVRAAQDEQTLPPLPASLGLPSGTAKPLAASAAPAGIPQPTAEAALEINLEKDGDLLREFCNESHEHLQNIENGVLVLEADPSDADTLNSIFRAFHTFKGGSGFLNLLPVKELAHDLESLLDLARQGKLVVDAEVCDIILSGGDILSRFVASIENQVSGRTVVEPILIPVKPLRAKVGQVIEARLSGKVPAGAPPLPPAVEPVEEEVAPEVAPPAPPAATEAAAPAGPKGPAAEEAGKASASQALVIKIDTQKLDSLMDLVGELVIAESLVSQDEGVHKVQSPTLARNLAQLGRITDDLQRTAMSLRLVPIRATFQKMHRLVRDLAHRQGKKVELVVKGEETELDRTIIEEINDPLMHMIRNSVDHGIECPDLREQRGKPGKGRIQLSAFHQAGAIVIEVKDDGNGLNKEKILAKAISKGLAQPGEKLDEKEIFGFIFAPGFSTADQITEISGRGVGMDVVRRNIEKLRGKIEVQSVPGQGSSFSIFLPLTLAIIDGLILAVGNQRLILPTLSVRESFQATKEMISIVQGRGEVVNVRGRLCPLLRLYDYLKIEPKSTDPTQGILMMVEAGHESRCVLVDQLLGKQEVVIKSLGEVFKRNPALAGATILGDGRVGLILDPNALVKLRHSGAADAG